MPSFFHAAKNIIFRRKRQKNADSTQSTMQTSFGWQTWHSGRCGVKNELKLAAATARLTKHEPLLLLSEHEADCENKLRNSDNRHKKQECHELNLIKVSLRATVKLSTHETRFTRNKIVLQKRLMPGCCARVLFKRPWRTNLGVIWQS